MQKCDCEIIHSNYAKPMDTKSLINRNSSIVDSAYFVIEMTELISVIKNMSRMSGHRHIQPFVQCTQFSEYIHKNRIREYKGVVKKSETILGNERDRIFSHYSSC